MKSTPFRKSQVLSSRAPRARTSRSARRPRTKENLPGRRPTVGQDIDWSVLKLSDISDRRRHFYVYIVLFLLLLTIHSIKNYSDPEYLPQLNEEIARLIELGAVAKGFY